MDTRQLYTSNRDDFSDYSRGESENKLVLFETEGSTRSLIFEYPDKRRMFFNYAYLVSVSYAIQEKSDIIILGFTSHNVSLYGYNLAALFFLLAEHVPKLIAISNPHYIHDVHPDNVYVTDIAISSK